MQVYFRKPRWNNNEWTFNVIPYIQVTKISYLALCVNFGWLFWGITISNDF